MIDYSYLQFILQGGSLDKVVGKIRVFDKKQLKQRS